MTRPPNLSQIPAHTKTHQNMSTNQGTTSETPPPPTVITENGDFTMDKKRNPDAASSPKEKKKPRLGASPNKPRTYYTPVAVEGERIVYERVEVYGDNFPIGYTDDYLACPAFVAKECLGRDDILYRINPHYISVLRSIPNKMQAEYERKIREYERKIQVYEIHLDLYTKRNNKKQKIAT